VLERFFKKKEFKLYLGSLTVAPRTDLKRHVDQWDILCQENIDSSLRKRLVEIFELPPANMIKQPTDADLGLDVVVPKFQSGDMVDIALGDFGFPLMWRPQVEVAARIYRIDTGKTVLTASSKSRITWKQYFSRLFTLRAFLRLRPLFDAKDLDFLLHQACLDLLKKLRAAV